MYIQSCTSTFELLVVRPAVGAPRGGVLGQDLLQPAQRDGGGVLIGDSVGEVCVQPLVELHDARQDVPTQLQPRVLQDKVGERVDLVGGRVRKVRGGEDGVGEGTHVGEPRVADHQVSGGWGGA